MARIKLNKNDKYRVLLTDLLPYEVPALFSNEGVYQWLDEAGYRTELLRLIFDKKPNFGSVSDYGIPYSYRIGKPGGGKRTLSVMHPRSQLRFAEFYEEYAALILHLCSRSLITLRAPRAVASHFFESALATREDAGEGGRVEVHADGFSPQERFASSYFSYRGFSFVYQFYESALFYRLEKRFPNMLTFDVSKCFYNIYTHSIAWATKSKEFAKSNKSGYSFEKRFDELMQRSNYNETNGILVGPEVSRIFAEIIFQELDLRIERDCEEKGLRRGSDYDLRRYVDDFFVFGESEEVCGTVYEVSTKNLEQFKLYVNENKTDAWNRPFVSSESAAKLEVEPVIDIFMRSLFGKQEENSESVRKFYKAVNTAIRDIRMVVASNGVDFANISRVAFSSLRKHFKAMPKAFMLNSSKEGDYGVQLAALVEFAAFIHAMDTNVRTTYHFVQLAIDVLEFAGKSGLHSKEIVEKKIADELREGLNRERADKRGSIEIINLLLLGHSLSPEYRPRPSEVFQALGLTEGANSRDWLERLGYFELMTLFHCAGDHSEGAEIMVEAVEVIRDALGTGIIFESAEKVMLFMDIVRCPYVELKDKKDLIKAVWANVKGEMKPDQVAKNLKILCERDWFWAWGGGMDLRAALQKKELRAAYG